MVRKTVLIAAALMLVLLMGCGDDSPETPEVEDPILPPTEDLLVPSFVQSLEDMSYEDLANTIHVDFRMPLLQWNINDWAESDHPINEDYFDRSVMMGIHENLFGEVEGMTPNGGSIPYVESISVAIFDQEGIWTPIGEGVEYFSDFPETFRARYNVLIFFTHPNGNRWEVDQTLDMIATSVTVGNFTSWQLLGIAPVGYESAAAITNTSYGSVLARYRF